MARRPRSGRKIIRALLPLVLVIAVGVFAAIGWIVHKVTHPPQQPYLITPEKFSAVFVQRGLKTTEETWNNSDGTMARGWLLRGAEGAPAVVLLHRYGADRSWLLNLGVKLNETTNYTILWPDLRGHGEKPLVATSTLGPREADDARSAIEFLRSLKTPSGSPQIGKKTGIYGVELGAYAAIHAASKDPSVGAVVLDSVPDTPAEMINDTVRQTTGLRYRLVLWLVRAGVWVYNRGSYERTPSCSVAPALSNRHVLLLAGNEGSYLRDSVLRVGRCFTSRERIEITADLPLTGYNLPSATGEQGEAYDRRVIEFFDRALRE